MPDEAESLLESGRPALAQLGHRLRVVDLRSFETADLDDVVRHGGGL